MSELKPRDPRTCPECAGHSLYQTTTRSGGGYGPILLPGLGRFLRMADFHVIVCADCGLTRFYAEQDARAQLLAAKRWTQL